MRFDIVVKLTRMDLRIEVMGIAIVSAMRSHLRYRYGSLTPNRRAAYEIG